MNAVFFASPSARASNFSADLDLVLLVVPGLERQLSGSICLHEEVAGLQGDVVENHKVFGWS